MAEQILSQPSVRFQLVCGDEMPNTKLCDLVRCGRVISEHAGAASAAMRPSLIIIAHELSDWIWE